MKGGGGETWGWYRAPKALRPLDPFRDPIADLRQKIDQVRSENLQENRALSALFKSRTQ